MSALGRVFRVQPGEGRTVALVVLMMCAAVAGVTIGESGIGALFFDRIGADALPVMYLLQGATGIVAMLVLTAVLGRVDRRRAYLGLPIALAALVAVERVVLQADPRWIYAVLWLTTPLAYLMGAVFLWGTAGQVTDTRRAKRLFPLFGAGGILGAVLGGLVTPPLAGLIGAANLLLVWVGCLVVTTLLCRMVLGAPTSARRPSVRRRRPSALRELAQGFAFVRRSPLLVWMTVAAVLFSVLYYSLYLPYAQAASARFPDPDELAGFFGIFWAGVTAAAFVVSMLLTNRLLGWFGAAAMILVLPVLYAGSFGVLLATSTFGTLVALRFGVNVWLQGVSGPAWETLINVAPDSRRDQARAFMNGGPSQVGTAIAGVITLVGQQALSPRQLSMIGLGAAVLTTVVAWRIRHSYAGALADALRAGRPTIFDAEPVTGSPVPLDRDAQALALVLEATRDADPRVRRLAVETLSPLEDDDRVRHALVRALDDDDALVRVNAVTALGRDPSPDDVPWFERALGDDDRGVRLAAVRALTATTGVEVRLLVAVDDPDPAVASAAAFSLLLRGGTPERAAERLRQLLSDDDPLVRDAVLGQADLATREDAVALFVPLLAEPSAATRAAGLRAIASADPPRAVAPAIDALADAEPALKPIVFDVLSEIDLRGHEQRLRALAEGWTRHATDDHALASSVPPDGEASALLRDALLERGRESARTALSTLALLSDQRDVMRSALASLDSAEPGQLANALEALEVVAGPGSVRPLLGLWETAVPTPTLTGPTDWLERASADPDPFIRACADLVRAHDRGDDMAHAKTSMSEMERILVLRTVPLFADLAPTDLSRVARIAEERTYADGEVVAAEGEIGDELHIVVEGAVFVTREGSPTPIARRAAGEVVGEMSIITRAPRVASLIADGTTRTVRIGQREFESMIRERPEVALAVMRVLAERLGRETASRAESP